MLHNINSKDWIEDFQSYQVNCAFTVYPVTDVFYDENGEFIMTVPDTMDNNLLDAINRLYAPFNKDNKFVEGIETMSKEDREKCKM